MVNFDLLKKENVAVEKDRMIINFPQGMPFDAASSALYSFSDRCYVLFDVVDAKLIAEVIFKNKTEDNNILADDIIAMINTYIIHKNKLVEKKEFVDFIVGLVVRTNDPGVLVNDKD